MSKSEEMMFKTVKALPSGIPIGRLVGRKNNSCPRFLKKISETLCFTFTRMGCGLVFQTITEPKENNMRIPQLSTCCCGCTLESGALIIGWLDLIGGVLLTSLAIFTVLGGSVNSEVSGGSLAYTIVMMINGILTIVISVCLIVGVNKRSHKLVRYWVIVTTISLVISFFGGMVDVIIIMVQGFIGTALTYCIAFLLFVALSAYLICVVHSLYREILAEVQPSVA